MNTFCSYYNEGTCKSCDLITLDYPAQILLKENVLIDELKDLPHPPLLKSITSPDTHFRNKAKLVVTGTVENPVIGLWGENDLDKGRELLNCQLHVKEINAFLPAIKEFITLTKLGPYQISLKKGELKGVILFHSQGSEESYLRFILRSREGIDRVRKHKDFLFNKFPGLSCLSVNIQPVPHALLEGEEEIFISEKKSIFHQTGKIFSSIGPKAFVQTNQIVAEKLYSTAAEWIKAINPERFMELFCGQGAFSFFCAPYIKSSLGVEINPEAVMEANYTAQKFNLPHLKFKSADAGKVEFEIKEFRPDVILVNPPRRGLAEAVSLLLQSRPKTIIYSSCNYQTLASDLKTLCSIYQIDKVQIFDMFPHTKHFETLVQLTHKANRDG